VLCYCPLPAFCRGGRPPRHDTRRPAGKLYPILNSSLKEWR
jgi:hypothetical protein